MKSRRAITKAAPAPKPGVLSYQQVRDAVRRGWITSRLPFEERQFQPSSLDLRLGEKAYRIVASFLPQNTKVLQRVEPVVAMRETDLLMYSLDLRGGAILEKGAVYLVPLLEELRLPKEVRAKSNPKSTTGRLDIFTRVITDFTSRFDEIRPGYRGPLYLEVVPRSFSVRVAKGMSLNQIRFMVGDCSISDAEIAALHEQEGLLFAESDGPVTREALTIHDGLFMSVDLVGKDTRGIVGFKSKKNSQVIDLSRVDYYDPHDYWEAIQKHPKDSLIIEPEEFCMFASKERIRVPPAYAAEMVAYDSGSGELRTHYAGFFDAGFGYGRGEIKGTRVVMEVRARDVPFLISDGQTFFKVRYERMAEAPSKVYGEVGSSYQHQSLTLSKHFRSILV
jgi:dCTP deaminase